jgi:putative DNA primase/helicase
VSATITSITAAEVQPEQVQWLWHRRIPMGELSILSGAPDRGKTQQAIRIAAAVTQGTLHGDLEGRPASVAFVSCEHSIERTLTPRFLAAGGDPSLVHFFKAKKIHGDEDDPSLELPADTSVIRSWREQTEARLLVLDPSSP